MATKAEIEKEIKEYEALIAKAGVPQDEKDFAEEEVKKLKEELAGLEEQTPEPPKKKPEAKAKPKRERVRNTENKNLAELSFEYEPGKRVKLTEANCFQVMSGLTNRLEKSKKANRAYATKPVAEKLATSLEQTAKKATDAVSDSRMENKPKEVIKGVEKMEAGFKLIFEGFEEMTGKKVPEETQKAIREMLKDTKEEAKGNA